MKIDLTTVFYFLAALNSVQGISILMLWRHTRSRLFAFWSFGFGINALAQCLNGLAFAAAPNIGLMMGYPFVTLAMIFFYSGTRALGDARHSNKLYVLSGLEAILLLCMRHSLYAQLIVHNLVLSLIVLANIRDISTQPLLPKLKDGRLALTLPFIVLLIVMWAQLGGVAWLMADGAPSVITAHLGPIFMFGSGISYMIFTHVFMSVHSLALVDSLNHRTKELERANRKLSLLSQTDALTALANRRKFNHTLKNEWKRANRHGGPLGLILLDVDYFKSYNDHYGHKQGDRCLKAIAKAINGSVQRADSLVARYGGEEFAVILPGVSETGVRTVAQRILDSVLAMRIAHEAPQVAARMVTVSMGAALLHTHDSPDSIFQRADLMLYEAKRGGKNQFVFG